MLGWKPEVDVSTLVKVMVDHDLKVEQAKLDHDARG